MHRTAAPLRHLAVVVFGDGRLPEMLLTCFQFRLAADQTARRSVRPQHLVQLQRHIARDGCRRCRGYLIGRLMERRAGGGS